MENRVAKRGSWVAISLLGGALLWPISAGVMPRSADHPVHLTRAWLFAQTLAQGDLRGWSKVWFFGTPIGELYPPLGDLLVIAMRVGSATLLSWPAAYALAFSVAFVAQGWALLRAGALMRMGPWPGLTAAALALLDVGAYREGGWIYNVYYGVWPQMLATALTWWSLAELANACDGKTLERRRPKIVRASVAMALALLAHPMSLLSLAIGAPIALVSLGRPWHLRWRTSVATGAWVAVLAGGWSAWWLVPMLTHRAWMASYGWLWLPLTKMLEDVMKGQWSQLMPSAVGHCVTLGIVLTLLRGNTITRAYAAIALVLWTLASQDIVWNLRLDLLSEGFTHLQYQRFITAAKPGLYLMAGVPVGMLLHAEKTPGAQWWTRLRWLAGLGLFILVTVASGDALRRAPYGRDVQRHHLAQRPEFDGDVRALTDWLSREWSARDTWWRTSVHEPRNLHWFMDLPVHTGGMPIFKLGFTPGDNFVHKPEQAHPRVLQRARVRYEIHRRAQPGREPVATFGELIVYERSGWRHQPIAWVDGGGTATVLEERVDEGRVRVRVSGLSRPAKLTFAIAGFPRWRLEGPEGPLEWREAPIIGTAPSLALDARRRGDLRGGKARGDDGTEPTLIQAEVTNGTYELFYDTWMLRDVAALLAFAGSLGLCLLLWRFPHAFRFTRWLGHRVLVASSLALLLAWGVLQIRRGRSQQAKTAVGWWETTRLERHRNLRPDFLKTEMLIRPALVVEPGRHRIAEAVFGDLDPSAPLHGWVALDDDEAQMPARGHHRLRVEWKHRDGSWTPLTSRRIHHRPGMQRLPLPSPQGRAPFDLRIAIESEGKRPPRVGFNVEVGPP